jgi:hypothetical protein
MGSVAHDSGRFIAPFGIQKIQCVLDDGRVAPIVLRHDEHERVVRLDQRTPAFGVIVRVRASRCHLGLVEKRQVHFRQIDDVVRVVIDDAGDRSHPLRDVAANAHRAIAPDDHADTNRRHDAQINGRTSSSAAAVSAPPGWINVVVPRFRTTSVLPSRRRTRAAISIVRMAGSLVLAI